MWAKHKPKHKPYKDQINRPVSAETTELVEKSSLSFIPTQVLLRSGKANPTSSTTKAGLNSSTTAKKKEKEKIKTDDESGTEVKFWSPSMDGIAGDVPPFLTYWTRRNSRFTNGGASMVSMGDEKVLYGSDRSSLSVFKEICREEDDQAMCKKKDDDNAME